MQMQNTKLNKSLSNDTVFNIINSKFISLQDAETKEAIQYLLAIVEELLQRMKSKDTLFAKTYKHITYCGSFYKGTKVGKPNEFDLNIVFNLPINYSSIDFSSTRPAFVKLNVNNSQIDNCLTDAEKRLFNNLILNGFLDPNKFRSWIEGIIYRVVNELPMSGNKHKLFVSNGELSFYATLKIKKSGPAFTLMLNILNRNIDVDLVPTLKFNITAIRKFISNFNELQNCQNSICFAIPVPVRGGNANLVTDQHWRLSFCLQENEILRRYGRVKPIIRQMKKLRDTQNWKSIASYYIETLFYNKLTELKPNLNSIPSTYFFFIMLKALCEACVQHQIHYFWNRDYNLLEKIGIVEMQNIAYRLKFIIKIIEQNIITDELILATYILNSEELSLLKNICNGQKHIEDEKEEQKEEWSCMIL
ncbi:unnamed protein product [Xylocopa violacea]|uniref:Uncharacterized protein n=1 Tax=Xylocopa violacea TaxID=135666 RepID=A0ABP1N826_XYLVO